MVSNGIVIAVQCSECRSGFCVSLSIFFSFAVLCCARARASAVTFRLSVRVSFLVCCGWYVCFSKPLTFHNGFMFFASRSCFKHFSRLQALLDM